MPFTTITPPAVGDPTKKTAFADAVINNLTDLNSRIGTGGASSGIPNSSFEDDGDADGDPDSWTVTNIGGTSGIIATSGDQAHGLNAWKVDYPASAAQGATIQTNDYIAISPDEIIYLAWKMKGTSDTGANHVITLLWYKFNKTAATGTSTEIYSDPANPTAWMQCVSGGLAPADATFMKIKIEGSDTTVPSDTGSISFDDIRIVEGPSTVLDKVVTDYHPIDKDRFFWVELTGGGGSGYPAVTRAGGGGGEHVQGYFQAQAGVTYPWVVGAAGGEHSQSGTASTFNTTSLVANGGQKTVNNTNIGGAGGTGGTGVIKYDGETSPVNTGQLYLMKGGDSGNGKGLGSRFNTIEQGQSPGGGSHAGAGGGGEVIIRYKY